jgi:hypothetical protein
MNRADTSRCSNRYHPNPTLEGVPNETSCILIQIKMLMMVVRNIPTRWEDDERQAESGG